jgi:hypothetical protein
MLLIITQGIVLLSAVSWLFWRILSRLVDRNDIDNVPGPASHSYLKGECRLELVFYNSCVWLIYLVR